MNDDYFFYFGEKKIPLKFYFQANADTYSHEKMRHKQKHIPEINPMNGNYMIGEEQYEDPMYCDIITKPNIFGILRKDIENVLNLKRSSYNLCGVAYIRRKLQDLFSIFTSEYLSNQTLIYKTKVNGKIQDVIPFCLLPFLMFIRPFCDYPKKCSLMEFVENCFTKTIDEMNLKLLSNKQTIIVNILETKADEDINIIINQVQRNLNVAKVRNIMEKNPNILNEYISNSNSQDPNYCSSSATSPIQFYSENDSVYSLTESMENHSDDTNFSVEIELDKNVLSPSLSNQKDRSPQSFELKAHKKIIKKQHQRLEEMEMKMDLLFNTLENHNKNIQALAKGLEAIKEKMDKRKKREKKEKKRKR